MQGRHLNSPHRVRGDAVHIALTIGITAQFLIVLRTLGEFFRLRHVQGTSFSAAFAVPYIGGALIATCFCWAGVILYFFRRYTLAVWTTLAAVVILLVYKIAVIGW
jgi:hypothetical protein